MKRLSQLLRSQFVSCFHRFARRRIAAELAETGTDVRFCTRELADASRASKGRVAARPGCETRAGSDAGAHFAFPSSGSSPSLPVIGGL
jgi:hypothetical protein